MHSSRRLTLLILVALLGAGTWIYWSQSSNDHSSGTAGVQTGEEEPKKGNAEPAKLVVETVASGLVVPWSLVFTDADRMLVTERPGRIRQIVSGQLRPEPVHTFTEVSATGEAGLMGLALDPDYSQNRLVYASLAYSGPSGLEVKVMRFRDEGDRFESPETILDHIPAASNHAGSRIHFGPDRKLYVSTGDATSSSLAQNPESLAGKILRMNADGSIPGDNPRENSLVFSSGHRNPQGFDWHPETDELYATEHGPSGFDGRPGGDEINHIIPDSNYGWPLVSHDDEREGTERPLAVYTPAIAPSGAAFYRSARIPQWTGRFLFTGLRGEGLFWVEIDPNNPDNIKRRGEAEEAEGLGRLRDVVEGPDGALYLLTSNRDGRGNPKEGDDRVIRIAPQE